ncbi:SAM-dependent MidA family methyltransferase [Pedobacter sp. CG_S7]|uniref:class I SAM-dependent methyltransferase n=1 Tax=Pedobacter sp. CG_S7 TaxID=3143930 RepID=UPI0033989A93
MKLQEIIIEKIRKHGPMQFLEFMEMCLYYPDLGYYTSTRNKIGENGDYYTSAFLTPVFGAMIGKKLEQLWENLGRNAFTVVEYGAGTGRLTYDILSYLEHNEKLFDQLRFCIIEKSGVMQKMERNRLTDKVTWYNSIQEIPSIIGCVFSNELLDNFSIHQVVMQEELMEVFVDYEIGFTEILKPAAEALKTYLQELNIVLPKGFRTEINLQALDWLKDIGTNLTKGYVMTIDYGYLSEELCKAVKSNGTLLCYSNHHINNCLYDHLGEQDITAHVNFSALMYFGERNGLKTCSYSDQCHFLLELGFKDALVESFSLEKNVLLAAGQVSLISHTLLYDMGSKYKVLIQEKC